MIRSEVIRFRISGSSTVRACIVLILICWANKVCGQWYDRYWISGYDYWPQSHDTSFGAAYFDFAEEPVMIYYNPQHSMSFKEEIGIIGDANGNLQFYTNGMQIQNHNADIIEGGIQLRMGTFGPSGLCTGIRLPAFHLFREA
jgi:hypothetical protein